ncbi:PREDICTED: uncharacterized protein LOC108556987 [Nicrophorus vespilloides]|uniref:Uncharacterized protein LOC108556987 n=1 Tax=Nicrophorus vespilloides TaxID=110193 RepID=A0ABM1M2N8_NICVS|nr:PREDICTED: uncharacterized protein LOC108556987 [Nicrophorus vespilloides]
MSQRSHCQVFLTVVLATATMAAFPPSLRHRPVTQNRILHINTSCDLRNFNVSVTTEKPFKGIIFAKDFSQECRGYGVMKKDVSVSFPTSGCGVRLTSNADEMFYMITVVVQQDKHLRQIKDQERTVQCRIENSAFSVNSRMMEEVIMKEIITEKRDRSSRTGRMKQEGWSKEISPENYSSETKELNDALLAARAWMEIAPSNVNQKDGILQVGEEAVLIVKSTLPVGIGWKVVDCVAHDGLGDSSQKLLDDNGCPVDELLLPEPSKGHSRSIGMMRHQEASSKFSAFKFPDRDRLHLSCSLQLCRSKCQKIDCGEGNRISRNLRRGEEGEILDRLEVFNSVEVLAPGIELEDIRQLERSEADPFRFGNIPGDRTFCVSPDKMALTFCVLGLIFLVAVIVAAVALYKARRNGVPMPYYTRSVFSSSSGSGSAYGSKLLLHESPCMGQSASVRGYGRIL